MPCRARPRRSPRSAGGGTEELSALQETGARKAAHTPRALEAFPVLPDPAGSLPRQDVPPHHPQPPQCPLLTTLADGQHGIRAHVHYGSAGWEGQTATLHSPP